MKQIIIIFAVLICCLYIVFFTNAVKHKPSTWELCTQCVAQKVGIDSKLFEIMAKYDSTINPRRDIYSDEIMADWHLFFESYLSTNSNESYQILQECIIWNNYQYFFSMDYIATSYWGFGDDQYAVPIPWWKRELGPIK